MVSPNKTACVPHIVFANSQKEYEKMDYNLISTCLIEIFILHDIMLSIDHVFDNTFLVVNCCF